MCILSVGSIVYWFWVPETKSRPLEEMAAIFGDTDEVKIYSADIFVNENHEVRVDCYPGSEKDLADTSVEDHHMEKV